MVFKSLGNYKVFLVANSIFAFAFGLFTPFYVIFLRDFGGGVQQFGFAIGLMALSQALISYFIGKYADKFGRKIFLLINGFVTSILIFGYSLITSLIQLYILQILNGMIMALGATTETTFLGDITEKQFRGRDVGKYHAAVGVMAAIAMMGGGYIVGELGFNIIFYITSSIIFVATLILFYIKE